MEVIVSFKTATGLISLLLEFASVKPTVTVSTILKFGPGVAPDPTKPLQDHLRKNLGRLSAPLNQKSLIQSVRIVHPGMHFTLHFLNRYYYRKTIDFPFAIVGGVLVIS